MRMLPVFVLILLVLAHPSANAHEAAVLESGAISQQEISRGKWSNGLHPVVLTEPGPVFTEGVEREGTELPYLAEKPKAIRYPRRAARSGWEGRVVLALEILGDGRIGRSQVMQSSGYRTLDQAALNAVKSWKFHPARYEGKSFTTCIQMPVEFILESASH